MENGWRPEGRAQDTVEESGAAGHARGATTGIGRKERSRERTPPQVHPREEVATATTMTAGARATRVADMAGPTNKMTIRVHIMSFLIFFCTEKNPKNVGPSG